MKKRNIALLCAVFALVLALFAACKVDVDDISDSFADIATAQKVDYNLTVMGGTLLRYQNDAVYTKSGNGYSWTGTVKQLNTLDAVEPYTVTTTQGTSADTSFVPKFKLDDETLFASSEATKQSLSLVVAEGSERQVLSLADSASLNISNLSIDFTLDDDLITEILVRFDSNGSNFSLRLGFTY